MAEYLSPAVYIEEIPSGNKPMQIILHAQQPSARLPGVFLVGLRYKGGSKTQVTGPITFLGHALLKVAPLPPDEFSVMNVGDPGGGAQQATVRRTLDLGFVMHKEKPV